MAHQRSRSWAGISPRPQQNSFDAENIRVDHLITDFMYESLLHRGRSEDTLNRVGIHPRQEELTPERELAQRLQLLVDSLPANAIGPDLLDRLEITENTAYEVFQSVAQQVIRQGLSWGRVLAVFLFGLELADRTMAQPGGSVLTVMSWLSQFIISNLLNWIRSEGGGWQTLFERLASSTSFLTVFGLAAATVVTVVLLRS